MSERRMFADWRFLAMLAFLLMVGYLVLTGIVAIQQNAEKGRQIDSLIVAAQRSDEAATRQRDELLAAQHRLLVRIDSYDARQRVLLAYLRRHGIEIPTRFIQAPSGGGSVTRSPGAPHKSPSGGQGGGGSLFNPPPPPGIAAPGNSGEHRHHHKKTHRLNRHAQ